MIQGFRPEGKFPRAICLSVFPNMCCHLGGSAWQFEVFHFEKEASVRASDVCPLPRVARESLSYLHLETHACLFLV